MEDEPRVMEILGGEGGEPVDPDRRRIGRVIGRVTRPFETCDVRQIRQIGRGLEPFQETGEAGAVLGENGGEGRMLPDEHERHRLEELVAHETADHREPGGQGRDQACLDVVAIDAEAPLARGSGPFADGVRHPEHGLQQGVREGPLDVGECAHIRLPGRATRRLGAAPIEPAPPPPREQAMPARRRPIR